MDTEEHRRAVEHGRTEVGLSMDELWLHCFGLGGQADPLELEAYLLGLMPLPPMEQDILSHAVNEDLIERGSRDRVAYSFDADDDNG